VRKVFVVLIYTVCIACLNVSGASFSGTSEKQTSISYEAGQSNNTNTLKPSARTPKTINTSKLYGLDSTKIGWGVMLEGKKKAPEVSEQAMATLSKYNAYFMGDTSKKKVYFVFSASYEGGYTAKILDVLRDNDAKTIFFLVGTYIKDNPRLVKRMIDEGQMIGNHSMTHPSLPAVSDERLKSELIGLDKYVYDNFGYEMKYFMPPSGEYSEKVLAAAKQMDYTSIFWSLAYVDYEESNQKGTQYAYSKVINNLHNGAIIFLHTVSRDNANALDSIIKEIKREGYVISPMDL
jgi:Predicted xylanase/chitin deacetylase